MKSLNESNDDYDHFLSQQDHEFIFTKGACHALALELEIHFQNLGVCNAEIHYCADHADLARHVYVYANGKCWDATGASSVDLIAAKWTDSDVTRLNPLKAKGWIICQGTGRPEHTSWLGMHVNPDFMEKARQLARIYISNNPDKFKP